ncbi:MAG: hypothetical protein ABW136_10205 [Steroidobacteraceae bacterium]
MNTETAPVEAASEEAQQPNDYATGFVQGYLRAMGIFATPTVPEFREALAELSEHLKEIRHHAH